MTVLEKCWERCLVIKKQNFYFKSSNKETKVHGICWIPEAVEVRAVLQIVHGMVEFVDPV